MFKPQNKIIIVDNNLSHLETLGKPFKDNGIGCRTYQYDPTFSNPLKNIRVAFFDINLNDLSDPEGNKNQIFATLVDALKLYIDKHNGPFALVFWTSNEFLISEFKDYVSQRGTDVPIPFLIASIDKDEFIDADKDLVNKLDEILSDKTIELLFDFENRAFESAAKSINQINNIIPATDKWGDNTRFKENFEKIFSKIATATLGFELAKKNPTKAVYSALIPILNYHIVNSPILSNWESFLKTLNTSTSPKSLNYPLNFQESRLNTVFHIEERKNISKDTRGAVIEFIVESPCEYSFFGSDYFFYLEKKTNELFDLFLNFNHEACSPEQREGIRSKSKFVLIEASAACDYSQNKKRINKYIFGLITPVFSTSYLHNLSACILKLPKFYVNENEIQLWLNFNFAYGFELSEKHIKGKPLFILKDEIMNMIGNRYANHVSRIGITSF